MTADEIAAAMRAASADTEPLRARIAELEKALRQIAAIVETQADPDIDAIHDIAREALNK